MSVVSALSSSAFSELGVAGTSVTFSLASPPLTAATSASVSSSDSSLLSGDFRAAPFRPLFDGKSVSLATGRGGCPGSLWTRMTVHKVKDAKREEEKLF
jgi:hypothetical protein